MRPSCRILVKTVYCVTCAILCTYIYRVPTGAGAEHEHAPDPDPDPEKEPQPHPQRQRQPGQGSHLAGGAYLVSSFIECLCVYVMDFRFVIARVLCSPCWPLMATCCVLLSLSPFPMPPSTFCHPCLGSLPLSMRREIKKGKGKGERNVDSILSTGSATCLQQQQQQQFLVLF